MGKNIIFFQFLAEMKPEFVAVRGT